LPASTSLSPQTNSHYGLSALVLGGERAWAVAQQLAVASASAELSCVQEDLYGNLKARR
jgi:hypothetical protein